MSGMQPLYQYRAAYVDNYDGDTIDVLVDLGLRVHVAIRLRLLGVDTPELRGDEREYGMFVRDHVRARLLAADEIVVRTYKDRTGKYGRWLATVFVDGVDLNADLVASGMAKRYPPGS